MMKIIFIHNKRDHSDIKIELPPYATALSLKMAIAKQNRAPVTDILLSTEKNEPLAESESLFDAQGEYKEALGTIQYDMALCNKAVIIHTLAKNCTQRCILKLSTSATVLELKQLYLLYLAAHGALVPQYPENTYLVANGTVLAITNSTPVFNVIQHRIAQADDLYIFIQYPSAAELAQTRSDEKDTYLMMRNGLPAPRPLVITPMPALTPYTTLILKPDKPTGTATGSASLKKLL